MTIRLRRFMERSGVLPTIYFAYRKGLGTCDVLLCVSHTLQSALESGQEDRIVQIYFSAAFDRATIGALEEKSSISSSLWALEVCGICSDTVSVKPIAARYGGWLSE